MTPVLHFKIDYLRSDELVKFKNQSVCKEVALIHRRVTIYEDLTIERISNLLVHWNL